MIMMRMVPIYMPLFLSAGKDLPATDSNGLCDPYIETTINGTYYDDDDDDDCGGCGDGDENYDFSASSSSSSLSSFSLYRHQALHSHCPQESIPHILHHSGMIVMMMIVMMMMMRRRRRRIILCSYHYHYASSSSSLSL